MADQQPGRSPPPTASRSPQVRGERPTGTTSDMSSLGPQPLPLQEAWEGFTPVMFDAVFELLASAVEVVTPNGVFVSLNQDFWINLLTATDASCPILRAHWSRDNHADRKQIRVRLEELIRYLERLSIEGKIPRVVLEMLKRHIATLPIEACVQVDS